MTVSRRDQSRDTEAPVNAVVKIGGGLLAQSAEQLDAILTELRDASRLVRLVVVPGGGPFADAVRVVDHRLSLSDSAAHWMAVLGMDQYAELLASRVESSALVSSRAEIEAAIESRRLPILAPYRWLRECDPLPHSWDVTGDSIAAWFTGVLGATRLVLVKPAGATGVMVDPYFATVVPPGVAVSIVPADAVHGLRGGCIGIEPCSTTVLP